MLNLVNSKTSGYAYQAEILVKLIKSGASFVHVWAILISEREMGQTKAFKFMNILKVISAYTIIMKFCWFSMSNERRKLISEIKKIKL